MAGGIINGQPVAESATNPAFVFKNADDVKTFKQGFGAMASPNAIVDINGDFAQQFVAITTGATENALSSTISVARAVGGVATSLNGIAGGFIGKFLYLLNTTGQSITVNHQSGSASAADRIITGDGLSYILPDNNMMLFYYDSTQTRWIAGPSSKVIPDVSGVVAGIVNLSDQVLGAGIKSFTNAVAFYESDVASAATITALASATSIVRLTGATATALQGIASGTRGKFLILYNVSTATLTLKNENAGATAIDRILTPDGADLEVETLNCCFLFYDINQSRWIAISAGGGGGGKYRAGSDAITNGTTSLAVVFSTDFLSTDYAVVATILNETDASPMFIPVTITDKQSTGFTASWNVAVDSANYVLEWYIVKHK